MYKGLDRPEAEIIVIESVLDKIRNDLYARLKQKGYGVFASNHEIYGVLAEEMKEYLDAIHANDPQEEKMKELSDIAVGAIFGIVSLKTGVDW